MNGIGIIGAGNVGEALAKQFVDCGYMVKVANSKGPASLAGFAMRTGATAAEVRSVSIDVSILIIAIPFSRINDLKGSLPLPLPPGVIVVDAGNYYPLRDGPITEIARESSETAWVSRCLGVEAVKAFNNIIASQLATKGRPQGNVRRIALPVAGGNRSDRKTIMTLIEEIGFDAYDAGAIENSWRQQPGMPAYCTDPTLAELPQLLRKANRAEGARNRDSGTKLMARLPFNYPAEQLVLAARFTVGLDRRKLRSWIAMVRLVYAMLLPRRNQK